MGTGNLTELTDSDSAGGNAILMGSCFRIINKCSFSCSSEWSL